MPQPKKKNNLSYSDTIVLEKIGNFIKKKRKEKGLSLRALSLLAFKEENSSKSISEIENAKTPQVSFIKISRILKELEIEII